MSFEKIPVAATETASEKSVGMNKAVAILAAPFLSPAGLANGDFSLNNEGSLSLGYLALPVLAFFGLAYLLHRKYPGAQVMHKALAVWLVGFLLAFLYLSKQESNRKQAVAESWKQA